MAMTNFGAGHETMASTLTSILAMIASHAEVQRKLAAEIRVASETRAYADAPTLRYTQAVIKEAMRLHPVIAMSLPRKTPARGLWIQQLWLPPSTTIGCNPVALHRNREIHGPDADDFKPGRWLNADTGPDTPRATDRCSLNWGGGSRSCPGRPLAELVVFKVVTRLLHRYDVRVKMPPESAQRSYFLSVLTGIKARFLTPEANPEE